LIYQKSSKKDQWRIIGKYENGLIYQKHLGKDKWGIVGKYKTCHGEAAFLLLFFDQDDTSAIVFCAM